MKIFDSHIHSQFNKVAFQEATKQSGIDFSMKGLVEEMQGSGVDYAVTISNIFEDETPIGLGEMIKQQKENPRLRAVCAVNPERLGSLAVAERALRDRSIIGFKIFLGYHPYGPTDGVYQDYYKLAQKHGGVIIFHTGDVYSPEGGYLKYSHPLAIDEVAVNYPDASFVLAHAGNPWYVDAGAVAYKNKNVWLDLSGLDLGTSFKNTATIKTGIKFLLDYAGPQKLLYGSDWPLVGMKPYCEMLKKIIPVKHHKMIFFENAWQLFGNYFSR
ncbi:MAG: amidohydrolase family protein [bacterium]|nr:amidohydrolase family protein [bacterium]